ncbi:MAG: hypothetical protein V4760_19755 [Bdellovibrionota bacterium]
MKAKTMFHSLLLAATIASSVSAHAQDRRRTAPRVGEEVGNTRVISIHEAGAAGRLADRLIIRSEQSIRDGNVTTVAKVFGDRIERAGNGGHLAKLGSFSEDVLMYLAQTGKCDLNDSACIVFEDKRDEVYRVATTPAADGSIAVVIGQMEHYGRRDSSTVELFERVDGAFADQDKRDRKNTRRGEVKPSPTRSVILTRANSSY